MAKYSVIVEAVNKILNQYSMMLTLRQIYYRLVSNLVIANTVSSYKTLSHMLVKAREKGDVDDRRIEDRSRTVLGRSDWGHTNFDTFIDEQLADVQKCWQYWTRSLWDTQKCSILIALEKDALSRLFTNVADDYRVQVFPTRGYGSYTYVKNMAQRLPTDKPIHLLYFGDYDPSGRDIQRDLGDRLVRYDETQSTDELTMTRIALTVEQIKEFNLPPKPEDSATLAKLKRDPRTKTYGMDYACELDAIEPNTLQELIRRSIAQRIDQSAWNARVKQINDEREVLKEKLSHLRFEFEE